MKIPLKKFAQTEAKKNGCTARTIRNRLRSGSYKNVALVMLNGRVGFVTIKQKPKVKK